VLAMREDETSMLFLVRTLLHYRCAHSALTEGAWRLVSRNSDVLAYERHKGDESLIVILNFNRSSQVWRAPASVKGRVAISTHGGRRGEPVASVLSLRPNEGVLIEVT